MIKILILMATLAAVVNAFTPSDTCNQQTWVTNGPVNTIVAAGGKVYIGGSFSRVGPFVNGSFDSAHSVVRNNLAALDAKTGVATAWDPNANQSVATIAVSGATVYVGGQFSRVGGMMGNAIAALDTAAGNALPWIPDWTPYPDGNSVTGIAVSGTSIFVCGGFSTIGGQSRLGIAVIDVKTGEVLPWTAANVVYFFNSPGSAPTLYGSVISLALLGNVVYVGGHFDSIGGQQRRNVAALDATTGHVLSWKADVNSAVSSLVLNNSTVYISCGFNTVNGQEREDVAALNATTGSLTSWNANVRGYPIDLMIGDAPWSYTPGVFSLSVSGSTVFVGGFFDSAGGQRRFCIAGLDATTGKATQWNPNPNSVNIYGYATVNAIAVSGSTVYVGGEFDSIGQGPGHPFFAQFDSAGSSPVVNPISSLSTSQSQGLRIIDSHLQTGASIKIAYTIPKAEHVSLKLYSVSGQLLSELVNGHQDAGEHTLYLSKATHAAGAYLAVFQAGGIHQEKMISLMK